jgi:uncharacterized protein (DUF362 family)
MKKVVFNEKGEMTRREFMKTSAVGAAGLAFMNLPKAEAQANQKYPYWGKVVVARDDSATDGPRINTKVIGPLLDESVNALTDGRGWKGIFPAIKSGDKVAIKMNSYNPGTLITHEEVLHAIVNKLMLLGVKPKNIIIFDFGAGKIGSLEMASIKSKGIRVLSTASYSVISSEGFDDSAKATFPEGEEVSLTRIISDSTYLINVPVLKDHATGGVTFALKNHVGSVDNTAKIHKGSVAFSGAIKPGSIAAINNIPEIKKKTRLVVGDGLFGIYQGGPQGNPQFIYNGLIVGTDPVAVDHQARIILDEERAKHGLKSIVASHIEEASDLGIGASPNDVKVIPVHRKTMG